MYNIEKIIINYLKERISVDVRSEKPAKWTGESIVTVEALGGKTKMRNKLVRTQLAINVYHQTRNKASELSLEIQEKLSDIADNIEFVTLIEQNVPLNNTDRDICYQQFIYVTHLN